MAPDPKMPHRGEGPPRQGGLGPSRTPKWFVWGLVAAAVALILLLPSVERPGDDVSYGTFIERLRDGEVKEAEYENTTGRITGEFERGGRFRTTSPIPPADEDLELMRDSGVRFKTRETGFLEVWGPQILITAGIIFAFFFLMRRAQGQMTGIMSIGRSRAKAYTTERPGTTFADVAGYEGVKQEISEIVDFLKSPERFAAIGARIPKGVLLVGPPGTGKTLIARAVAGEAGVPFLSVTGSDFMEMFVGVGASRVRDLFETARRMGRAIIFIDEIDSIGRKRGAGLGGGHDEREQTLNQMLAEMDGFEPAEGIVMMAATNRPDILDPALLRPGRFDRQVVVPLPEAEERLAILRVHCKDKKIADDVDLNLMARSTPGMSGADLANLVNEAALAAVREGADEIHMRHLEYARDRVLIGQRRESVAMTEEEKEITAYHEGGHALVASVLPNADQVHKVTILPTGMALGVTQILPEERHHYPLEYLEDKLAYMLAGRVAERVVFGTVSTGAGDDLVKATELARKMVREWGMSERVGPMAWSSHGQVFLGEDLMHTRDYSDDTARVIDEEVERILREQEERAESVIRERRKALDLIARSLVEHETIDGAELRRLIELASPTTDTAAEQTAGDETEHSDEPSAEPVGDALSVGADPAGEPRSS